MTCTPSTARGRLSKRRAWLIARSEHIKTETPEAQTHFLDEEVEALDLVLGILEAVGGERNGGAVASEAERVQRARDVQSAREKRCSCARCPVHGTKSSGKVGE